DAVRLVVEALRKVLCEIPKHLRTQKLRVNLGHTVRAVRADDREVRHTDATGWFLFYQAHAARALLVEGTAPMHVVEQPPVDFVDDLELPGNEQLEELDRPLFQSFRQQRVVRVRQRPNGQVPRQIPRKLLVIQ